MTHCYIHKPTVVFAARVNMPSVTYPVYELAYDDVTTGSYTNIVSGMTLLLGTSAGADDLGRQRVRTNASGLGIPIGWSSRGTRDGELDVQDNAYITVLDDFRVWAKIPKINTITGGIEKDGVLGPMGNVDTPPPTTNGGGAFAATINPSTGVITVELSAFYSYQFDPSLSSALSQPPSFVWDVRDGTITVGTSTSPTITATFPAGFRHVYVKSVGDNGAEHVKRIPVLARDPNNDVCVKHQIVRHRIDPYMGVEMSIRIVEDLNPANYPDGTLVMVWDREPSSPSDRTHMEFVGWHHADDASTQIGQRGTLKNTVLDCVSVAGKLATLPGFSQVQEAGDPVDWYHTKYPNAYYYLWYLLHWHSTALDVADIELGTSTLHNYAFYRLDSDADNLYQQVQRKANSVTPDHHLCCTQYGALHLTVDMQIQNVAERSLTVNENLSESDWQEIRYRYNRPPTNNELVSYAVISDDEEIVAIACKSPGDAKGQGANSTETNERIAAGQFVLNTCEGNRYARFNAPFAPFAITVPYSKLSNQFEPAYLKWTTLTISNSNASHRLRALSGARGIVQGVDVRYNYDRTGTTKTATIAWEMETSGPPAVTVEVAG